MNTTQIKRATLAGIAALGTLGACQTAQAQSADALIDKLVEKGILNQREAQDLREESDKGFTTGYAVKSGMPDWVTALKFNGDFRGRYEGFYSGNSSFVDRTRLRYRLRFGVTANLQNDFEVGFRLGSGDLDGAAATLGTGIDPISNNQTLQNNGSKKGIFLDTAYAKWSPIHNADWAGSISLGKIDNPFHTSDIVFDNDYTPEGVGTQLSYNLTKDHTLKLLGGGFILDELGGSSKDPFLTGAQLRWDAAWTPKLSSALGVGLLTILGDESLGNGAVPNINRGNTRKVDGTPAYGYNPVYADGSVTYLLDSFPLYEGAFPIKVGGDFLHNGSAPSHQNEGYSIGATLGKSGKKGLWDLSYTYKSLESDAWWEELTDSDSGGFYLAAQPNSGLGAGYGSGTNIRGHVFKFSYSPFDHLTLTAKWFHMDTINEVPLRSSPTMDRLQLDAMWKF